MWASRWLTSKPHRMARSIWARHSRRTSSRSAWSQTSSHRAREPPVAVEERGGVGDRSPAVEVELGVDREVHPDVVAPVAGGGAPRPWTGDHQAGAGGQPVAQGLVHAHVGGVAEAEVVAVEDQELGILGIAESFGERWHASDGSALRAPPVRPPRRRGSGGVGGCPRGRPSRARAARAAARPRRPTRRVGSSIRQSLSGAGRPADRSCRPPGVAAVGSPRSQPRAEV